MRDIFFRAFGDHIALVSGMVLFDVPRKWIKTVRGLRENCDARRRIYNKTNVRSSV